MSAGLKKNRRRVAPISLIGKGLGIVVALLMAAAGPVHSQTNEFTAQIRPVLDQYCGKCHGHTRAKGGVNLADFTNTVSVYREPQVWEKVLAKVGANEMPPEDKPQLQQIQRDKLIQWTHKTLDDLEQGRFAADPGRVRIHRLSRTEYNCTIRDLLGVDTHAADTFPTEGGGGGGFDNNADTLFVPPILMERYLAAASALVAEAP